MFEQDYLMRLLAEFVAAMRRSMERAQGHHDPAGAAKGLESAVGAATDIDGETLLGLTAESVASILQVSGTDPQLAGYMARSLLLASTYYRASGDEALAELRRAQALAIAQAFGHELSDADGAPDAVKGYLDESGLNA